jgi:hypothetical protein
MPRRERLIGTRVSESEAAALTSIARLSGTSVASELRLLVQRRIRDFNEEEPGAGGGAELLERRDEAPMLQQG